MKALMPPVPGKEWQLLSPELQAVTPILTCRNCGRTMRELNDTPNDLFPSEHCGDCPPWRCEACGERSSAKSLCSCCISFDGMPLADIKALFAMDGTFNIGGLGTRRREDGSDV